MPSREPEKPGLRDTIRISAGSLAVMIALALMGSSFVVAAAIIFHAIWSTP